MASVSPQSVLPGPDCVSCLSLTNKLLASGFENGSVYIWSPDECVSPICLFPSSILCSAVAFSDNDLFLYSSYEGNVNSWDLRKIKDPLEVWRISDDEINSIDHIGHSSSLAVADDTGTISVVKATTGKITNVFTKHENICSAAKFRPGWPNQLISAGLDCRLVVSNWVENGRTLDAFEMGGLVKPSTYVDLLSHTVDNLDDGCNDRSSSECEDDIDDDNDGSSSLDEQCTEEATCNDHVRIPASLRVPSSVTVEELREMAMTRVLGHDLPLNPPMIHSLTCTPSGTYVAVGLGSGMVEVFHGEKHLRHVESLLGHRSGVAALLAIEESYLLSGGNDRCLFLWELSGGTSHRFNHSNKISALTGRVLSKVYMADNTSNIQVLDLTQV